MRCPYCGGETRVIDKRGVGSEINTNRRRRECLSCKRRFTTYERAELTNILVIKKDNSREQFDRNKIKRGVIEACKKRPVTIEQINKIVDNVEKELLKMDKEEIKSSVIGDLVIEELKKVDKVAYVRFASVYKEFTDLKSYEKALDELKVIKEVEEGDTTDLLLVATTRKGYLSPWNKKRIISSLIKEVRVQKEQAEDIADSVEKKIIATGIKTITVNLIRELIDNELLMRGYDKKIRKHTLLGMPTYNLNQLIFSKSNENSNVMANNPEAINLAIAENTLKQYALQEVFSEEVSDAHLSGKIYLHDLGYPIRVYCSAHSLEYLKKFGLHLENLTTDSSPAKHAQTLTGHLNTFLATMQAYYAGALGISHVNIFYAPFLKGMSEKQLKQEAQYLIFSCSQNAFSRGGQTLFIDFNVHLEVPQHLKNVPAIGKGGKYMLEKGDKIIYVDEIPKKIPQGYKVLTYQDFEPEAQAFAKALMDVWEEGDAYGKPFPFPKLDLHINQNSFEDPVQKKLLMRACEVSSKNGSTYFVFDRDDVVLSACCRLRTKVENPEVLKHPEKLRFCGFQNVSINLPQAAYRGKTVDGTLKELNKMIDLAMKAHFQKRKFIEKLMSKPEAPLWQVGKISPDGEPYIDLDKATYIIGIIGLNECVKHLTGKALHESEEAYKLGIKIISSMYLKIKELEKKTGLKISLEETPAESASLRLATMDLRNYPEQAKPLVKGNIKTGEVYYTNSIHFEPDANIDILERIEKQARFNPLIESGAITHVFVGEERPSAESIFNLVKRTWENTQSAQIVISPEFTVCEECHKVSAGFNEENMKCPYCGSENVYGMSRVVGYYSVIKGKKEDKEYNNWNKSKLAELKDRKKGNYSLLQTEIKGC